MESRLYSFVYFCLCALPLWSQSGSLDPTFSGDGIDIIDLGIGSTEIAYGGALQPDGKILIVGWSNANSNIDFAVVRYLQDGTRDISFGTNGVALVDYNGTNNRGSAITVQPDGKIVVAGATDIADQSDFSVLRLHPDGTPDSTFGQNGWMVTDLGTTFEYPNAVEVQSDGKIILAGRVDEETFADFGMIRYTSDGQLDTFFGVKGIVITDFREEDLANDILIQPDGQIILGGFSSVSALGDFALARYNADGTLDKSFGTGGKVLTDLEGNNQSDFINDLVLLDDGKIIAAGNANYNNLEFTSDMGIVKYNPNGTLDESFGQNGVFIHSIGGRTNVQGVAVQHDGKIVLGGETDAVFGSKQWIVSRYKPEGGLDTTFGGIGWVTTQVGNFNNTFPNGVFIQDDSRIVLTGTTGMSPNFDFAAVRFIADFVLSAFSTEVSCFGVEDGTITVAVNGGVPPYLFSIDGIFFQKSNVFTGLAPGEYTIVIKDSNGSGVTGAIGPIVIPQSPTPPAVHADVVESSVTLTVDQGGFPPFLYSNNGGTFYTSSNTFNNLTDGAYSFVVIDDKGCIIFDSIIVIQVTAVVDLNGSLSFSFSPNPSSGKIHIVIDATSSTNAQASVMDMTGRILFQSSLDINSNGNHEIDLGHLESGTYMLFIRCQEKWGVKKLIITR
jgi:uncharacterized delta-60 repeat protein